MKYFNIYEIYFVKCEVSVCVAHYKFAHHKADLEYEKLVQKILTKKFIISV